MRTLWILFTLFILTGKLDAQFSRIDSSFILQYSIGGVSKNERQQLIQADTSLGFFLVKFSSPITDADLRVYPIARLLSNQLAILKSITDLRQAESRNKIEYAFPANNKWKLPDGIRTESALNKETRWVLVPFEEQKLLEQLRQLNARVIEQNFSSKSFIIEIKRTEDLIHLLNSTNVRFLQPLSKEPREELLINGFDLGTNGVNLLHEKYPGLNGAGLVVSVKENKFDTADSDFKGRVVSTGLSSSTVSGHASIMATMIGGGGNTYHLGKGVAWNSQLSSANFAQLFPSADVIYNQFHISVENHSYGTGIENFYGADAAAYDASVINSPYLLHVFSSGNSGTSSSSSGSYAGIANFANLTGSFKMAKNILTVGATDSFANVELLSSRGPAYDGRMKPDVVAFGQDGSSGAAALVSGTALVIQQAFKSQHNDSLPPASLLKAALITSADDIGAVGPDFISGFGSLNAEKAVRCIIDRRYFLNSITDKNTQLISLVVPTGLKQLKVTLAYSDPPAQANSFKALVNDVDIEVTQLSTGQVWKPWVLNGFPNRDSLLLPASRNRDSLNNVEQITIDNPAAGNYQVRIFGYSILNASQPYAITYQADTADVFEWSFPTAHDVVFAGTSEVARWNETFNTNGSLEFSGDEGNTWQTISTNVDLHKKYIHWNVPDSFSSGILRMSINGSKFQTDKFVISRNIQMQVGFNCQDSVLLTWNSINKADHYRVYALTSNFLQPVVIITDTFLLFPKNSLNSKHLTVAPISKSGEGAKAYTINYETQGVACYIKNFLAQLTGDNASLLLDLGTLFQVNQIEAQRADLNNFISFQTINNPTALSFHFDNLALHQGVNKFRVKLTLANGKIVYSGTEIVYFTGNADFVIYPNPAPVANGFSILRKDLEDATLIIYDQYGRKILEFELQDLINPVKTSPLQRGVYFIGIHYKNGTKKHIQRIVLQ